MSTLHASAGLEAVGIRASKPVHVNLQPAVLYEHAIRRAEGIVAAEGPLVCRTGSHTGRSPNDKFVVKEPSSEGNVWWGKVNRPMQPAHYDALRADVVAHLGQQELFVRPVCRRRPPTGCRSASSRAAGTTCSCNLSIARRAICQASSQFMVITAPSFKVDPARHGTSRT
jgi:phosphoenolpyruvate carboxykinase (ATP)